MKIQQNTFKRALLCGESQIGLWSAMADGYAAEICAGAGFDWLLLDGEHAPNHLRTLLAQLQAVAAYPVHPVVRPVKDYRALIKQLLDIGVTTLLVPMVESAEQAAAIVAATRYAPKGTRGVGAGLARASRWGRIANYMQEAESEICVLVQIESRAGVENLESIAAVEGVDGVFIGPADLAADMGKVGGLADPEVRALVDRSIQQIRLSGKAAGTLAIGTPLASQMLAQGCTFVAAGVDSTLLARAADQLAASLKGTGQKAGTASSY